MFELEQAINTATFSILKSMTKTFDRHSDTQPVHSNILKLKRQKEAGLY